MFIALKVMGTILTLSKLTAFILGLVGPVVDPSKKGK